MTVHLFGLVPMLWCGMCPLLNANCSFGMCGCMTRSLVFSYPGTGQELQVKAWVLGGQDLVKWTSRSFMDEDPTLLCLRDV